MVASEASPGAHLHLGLRGVRARAAGQRVGRPALRGRRHGDDRRPPQPRQRRRLPASASRCAPTTTPRSAAWPRPAPPPASTTGPAEDGDALPHGLPLHRGRADRGHRRALGRRRDRERGHAPARHREPARRVLRARLAGRGERAGARGPDRLARPAREGRRRAAPPAGAQPARRRAVAARLGGDRLRVARTQLANRPEAVAGCSSRRRGTSTPAWPSCASSPAACTRRCSSEHGLRARSRRCVERSPLPVELDVPRRAARPRTSRRPSTTSSPRR